MPSLDELRWSDDVARAAWVAERLTPPGDNRATSVVPAGFEAYARILHPAEEPGRGHGRLVRWREVAAWSGLPLDPYAQFHSVALLPEPVGAPPPWSGQGPREGRLFPPDAAVLAEHLARHTEDPTACWFCLWDGYGWQGARFTSDGSTSLLEHPVPAAVQDGPRVRLPHRDYFLYQGAVDAALVGHPDMLPDQTANLWWPEDRAWCVASEIDLSWTYVGGSADLVTALVGEPAIEALAITPDGPVFRTEPWVERWVGGALDALLADGHALIRTPVGTLEARLERPGRLRRGSIRIASRSALGHHGGGTQMIGTTARQDSTIRHQLHHYLVSSLVSLVG